MMGVPFLALIALLYLIGAVVFGWARNGPQVLICFGCFLVIIGNIWQIAKSV